MRKIINDRWQMLGGKKEERQVFTMSRALANAITMSAEYSGRRVKFTDFRK